MTFLLSSLLEATILWHTYFQFFTLSSEWNETLSKGIEGILTITLFPPIFLLEESVMSRTSTSTSISESLVRTSFLLRYFFSTTFTSTFLLLFSGFSWGIFFYTISVFFIEILWRTSFSFFFSFLLSIMDLTRPFIIVITINYLSRATTPFFIYWVSLSWGLDTLSIILFTVFAMVISSSSSTSTFVLPWPLCF